MICLLLLPLGYENCKHSDFVSFRFSKPRWVPRTVSSAQEVCDEPGACALELLCAQTSAILFFRHRLSRCLSSSCKAAQFYVSVLCLLQSSEESIQWPIRRSSGALGERCREAALSACPAGTSCPITETVTMAWLLISIQAPQQWVRKPLWGQTKAWGLAAPSPRPSAYFVGSGEAGPRLVGPAVIVLSVSHLHIVAKADEDLPFPKFFHCGPLAELQGGRETDAVNQRSLDRLVCPGIDRCGKWGPERQQRDHPASKAQGSGGGPGAPDSWTWDFSRTLRKSFIIPWTTSRPIQIDSQAVSFLITVQRLGLYQQLVSVCACGCPLWIFPWLSYFCHQVTGILQWFCHILDLWVHICVSDLVFSERWVCK